MKKLISVILRVIFVFVMLSQFVLNVSAVTIGSAEYDFYYYKNGIGLSNYKGKGGFVSIPARFKNAFDLLRIDTQAFYNKSNVTGVEIPNTVTTLGDKVFEKCANLKSVTISGSVTSFGRLMFFNCYNLEDVVFGNGMTSIPGATFANCKKLRSLTIPESVTYIGDSEFIECPNLTIYGYNDSYAESYAKQNKIAFVSIDEIPEQTTNNTSSSTKPETPVVSTSSDISSSTQAEIPVISDKTSDTSSKSSSIVTNEVSSTQEAITSSEDKVSSNENVSNDTSTTESKEISLETTIRKNKMGWSNYIAIIITIILIGGGAAIFSLKRK